MPEKLDFKLNPSGSKNGHLLVVEGILIWNLPKRAWLFTSSPYTCKAQICSISEQASCWLPVILRNCCQLKPGSLCGNAASPVLISVWIWCRRSLATCIYFTFMSPVDSSLLLLIVIVSKYSSLLGRRWLSGFSCAGIQQLMHKACTVSMAMKNWCCTVTTTIYTVPWFNTDAVLLHLLIPYFLYCSLYSCIGKAV